MQKKRQVSMLALVAVAVANGVPQTSGRTPNPTQLSNDFVFGALARETSGNFAVAPGGALAGLAGLGAAGHALPPSAARVLGDSPESAERLVDNLARIEGHLPRSIAMRHSRNAWLTEAVSIDPNLMGIRPAEAASEEAPRWLDRVSPPRMAKAPTASAPSPAVQKPTGLATVTVFEAPGIPHLNPLPPPMQITFAGKRVESLTGNATTYLEDDLGQTVSIALGRPEDPYLVLSVPRPDRKLSDLTPGIGARLLAAISAKPQLAFVRLPRIQAECDDDLSRDLGLNKSDVSVRSRTFVWIGAPYRIPGSGKSGNGVGSAGRVNLPIWNPQPPLLTGMPTSGRSGSGQVQAPPVVTVDRPFYYAVIDPRSRAVLLAGTIQQVPAAEPEK
jgi:hypothetical protein